MFKLNRAAEAKLLDPIHPHLGKAVQIAVSSSLEGNPAGKRRMNRCHQIYVTSNGISFGADLFLVGSHRVQVWIEIDPEGDATDPRNFWRYDVPIACLQESPARYSLYQIRFSLCSMDDVITEYRKEGYGKTKRFPRQHQLAPVFWDEGDAEYIDFPDYIPFDLGPLAAGYIGITKRNPFTRLKEHQQSALNGAGYQLHRAWRNLIDSGEKFSVVFQFSGSRKTLAEIYDAEESFVGDLTLTPKGLNAIPGGMAGIRMLHQLRLLDGVHQVTVEQRDEALVKLEREARRPGSPCAHYRSGHLRRLPTGRLIWVSACWVNPERAVAA